MKTKFLQIIPIIGIIMVSISCRKIDVPSSELNNLFGEWEWVQSTGGESYTVYNPATVGYSKQIEFQKNGVYKYFEKGNKIEKMRFSINEYADNEFIDEGDNKTYYQIDFEEPKFNVNFSSVSLLLKKISNDSLVLIDINVADGCTHLYVKK